MAYLLLIRPWHLRWGATLEEARRELPGDYLVRSPFLKATRAITIDAPLSAVWPWLVQMGYRRAGFYSYDWIDNDRIPSADRIVPELQHLQVGELVPTGPGEGFRVAVIDPERALVLQIDHPRAQISSALVLASPEGRSTRLIMRLWARFPLSLFALLYYPVFEPGDFVMMRKELLGIKARAERAWNSVPA